MRLIHCTEKIEKKKSKRKDRKRKRKTGKEKTGKRKDRKKKRQEKRKRQELGTTTEQGTDKMQLLINAINNNDHDDEVMMR